MRIIGRHTDSAGRSTGERVNAAHPGLTDDQHAAETRRIDSVLDAADRAEDQTVTLDTVNGL